MSSIRGSEVQTPKGWLALNARVSPATRVSNNSRRIWPLAQRYCLLGAVCQLTVYVLSYLYQPSRGWKSTRLITGFRLCRLTSSVCGLLHINTFELFLGFTKPFQASIGHWKWYVLMHYFSGLKWAITLNLYPSVAEFSMIDTPWRVFLKEV